MSGRERIDSGRRAEDHACRYLEKKGYRIAARNVRSGRGEVDIIARGGDTLAIVEVRSRRERSPLMSSEIVGFRKRRNVGRVAREIIGPYRRRSDTIRFDVIIVTIDDEGRFVGLEHIENAFSSRGEIM